jgi:hypothetical protein
VDPKSDEVLWLLNSLNLGSQKSLEDVCQMPDIEFVMEVLGSLPEVSFDFSMDSQGGFNDRGYPLDNAGFEALGEMFG